MAKVNPELRTILAHLNKNEFLDKQEFNKFLGKYEEEQTIMVGNGEKEPVRLNKAIGMLVDRQELTDDKIKCMDNKIVKILDAIGFYLDARNVIAIVKKHKIITTGIIATLIRLWIG